MADITTKEPTKQDIEFIAANLRGRDQTEFDACSFGAMEAAIFSANLPGVKRCLYADGEPVFVGGFVPVGHDIVQAWGFGTEAARRYMIAITKETRKLVRAMVKHGEVKRIQAQALVGPSADWLKVLGLKNSVPIGVMNGQQFVYVWGEWYE